MSSYYCSMLCVYWSILKAELRDVKGKGLLSDDPVTLEDKIWARTEWNSKAHLVLNLIIRSFFEMILNKAGC